MAFKVRAKKGVRINKVVTKIVVTVLALYVGGTIMTQIGNVMVNQTSPMYSGLQLIGYTVDATGKITSVNGTGILAVIGIVGIASVVTEFVEFSL